ncbi:MAG: rod shape-determining protein [Firmicutes bacterium]|nr:rod shape-determining protein [Bacillota bacterium]
MHDAETAWVAVADLGTTKTLALVAVRERAGLRVVAHGQAVTRGLRHGRVTDVAAAASSLRLAVERAAAGLAELPPLHLGVAAPAAEAWAAGAEREAAAAAGLEVAAVVPNALAAAEAVLDRAEAEAGAAVVDIGGGSCDVAAFDRGRLVHTASIGMGSAYITNDLAIGLGIPWAAAESLKLRHARVDGALLQKTVEVPTEGGTRAVELPFVQEIALARVDEILEAVKAALEEARAAGCRFGAGVVLTGGGAALRGLAKRAMEVWDLPVRFGAPQLGDERWTGLETPQAAAAMGLLRLAAAAPAAAAASAREEPPATFARRLWAWLAGLV